MNPAKRRPGQLAVRHKYLPITEAPYSAPGKLRHPVRDEDLVIGLARGGEARAYPLKMLGGPHREIINTRLKGEPCAVNW